MDMWNLLSRHLAIMNTDCEIIGLKMLRFDGRPPEFLKMVSTLETTFMMDTIYVNFGVRPAQFHQALQEFKITEEPEVVEFLK